MRQWRLAVLAVVLGCGRVPLGSLDERDASVAYDAREPARVGDAGAGSDADDGGGGRDDADSSGQTWCDTRAPVPVFCDDFDRGELGAKWDFFLKSPPGTATLDVAGARSAPNALVVVTRKVAAAEFGSILLRKTVGGSPSRARLGFDLLADATQPSGTLAVATLDLAADHLLTLYLRDENGGAALVEVPPGGAAAVRYALAVTPAAGQWTRIELDVDAAGGRATLRFDGATVLDAAALTAAKTDKPTLRVGVLTSGPADTYQFRFDNVSLDVAP